MAAFIFGLIFAVIGAWGLVRWFQPFMDVVKGFLPVCLLLGGILAIVIGISTIKEGMQEKTEKKEEPKPVEEKK